MASASAGTCTQIAQATMKDKLSGEGLKAGSATGPEPSLLLTPLFCAPALILIAAKSCKNAADKCGA